MLSDRIIEIIEKYRRNEITSEEFLFLKEWISQSSENETFILNYIKLYKTEMQWEVNQNLNKQDSWNQLFIRLNQYRRKKQMLQLTVAACSLIVLCVASYFLLAPATLYNNDKTKLIELFPHTGTSQALLTLSTGKTVQLQDTATFEIKESDGTIINYSSFQTVYRKNKTSDKQILYNTLSVPRGGEYSLTLPDGTKVWVNAESTIHYPIHFIKDRIVELTGEAYFEVKKNDKMPFTVKVGDNKVQVLGTKFNISAYKSESMFTTLVEGKVNIQVKSRTLDLKPNEQAEIAADNSTITVRQVNATMYSSWATGVFEFENTSLKDIMGQLSRWYNTKIEFASPEIENIKFTGTILRNKTLGFALYIIQQVSDVKFEKEDYCIKVSKR